MNKAVEILLQKRLMILERGASVEDLQGIVPALYAAGIRVFEVTFSPMDPDMVKHGIGCYHKDVQLSTKSRCVFCDVVCMGERHAKFSKHP